MFTLPSLPKHETSNPKPYVFGYLALQGLGSAQVSGRSLASAQSHSGMSYRISSVPQLKDKRGYPRITDPFTGSEKVG